MGRQFTFMTQATVVATLLTTPSPTGEELAALPAATEWLEVRADLVGDVSARWLREHFRGRLIYTLRSAAEGGSFAGADEQRHRRLMDAAREYDLIDLEGDRDLSPGLLGVIPAEKRLISWQGAATGGAELNARFDRFSLVPARLYKFVQVSAKSGDEVRALTMLKALGRKDVIAFTTGQQGVWSRLAALHLGAPWVFGAVGRGCESCGELPVSQLIEDYGLPDLTHWEEVYGIVGSPVSHSLSPRLHNAAYRALGRRALFVPFYAECFSDFWRNVVLSESLTSLGLPVKGFTVASPHKEVASAEAEVRSPLVRRIGATNIFVCRQGVWEANTTDPEGAVVALLQRGIEIFGKKAAVIGCGGAGRAIAAALDEAGAFVTVVNRSRERGEQARRLLNLPFISLSEFSAAGFSIVVNATPVGRDDNQSPFDVEELSEDAVVIDLPYGAAATPLVSRAHALNRAVIDGREVLLIQVLRQFRLMTDQEMPVNLARKVLGMRAELEASATAGRSDVRRA